MNQHMLVLILLIADRLLQIVQIALQVFGN